MIYRMEPHELQPFEQLLAQAWPAENWRDVTVIAAVSGGPDSVALLRALAKLKALADGTGKLIVAHFNHKLRADSDLDTAFVAKLAGQLGLLCETEAAVATDSMNGGDGIEAAARSARYSFLQRTAERCGARFVATGHTADDQIETVLFNILRGTGLSGLAGMPRVRLLGDAVSLIRPILGIRRIKVAKYLEAIGQPFQTDATNASSDFTRNRIRNELLPLLRSDFNSDVDAALARLSRVAADAQGIIETQAVALLDRCLLASSNSSTAVIDASRVQNCDRHLVREMFIVLWRRLGWPLQNIGFDECEWLATMTGDDATETVLKKREFPGSVLVERRGNELRLQRENKTNA